jgi:pyrophosphate--fructose-6-phosphate 1-phosphotransferase
VCSQVVANNATDGASTKKYYYFMRLLGDEPSHCAMEVALKTKPNFIILGEEVKAKRLSLNDIVRAIADMICERLPRLFILLRFCYSV